VRYLSADEDSSRWSEFVFRDGDIVISTRSKSGTTWMQMICALLVFQSPELPAPLSLLSPWLDRTTTPLAEVLAHLEAQSHRRFIKTHTPLDGIPLDPRATYIVVGRHPLDMAVSLYHQGDNINRARLRQLTGQPEPAGAPRPRLDLHSWLLDWIDSDADPAEEMDGLRGVLWHASDAWQRRDQPNILLVHYEDLVEDLDGQMRRLAAQLNLTIPSRQWPELVHAATFDSMRERSDELVPNSDNILKDNRVFFRRGRSGAGFESLTHEEAAHYYRRVSAMAPADVLQWLHRKPPDRYA
jgi:hypothetical protein